MVTAAEYSASEAVFFSEVEGVSGRKAAHKTNNVPLLLLKDLEMKVIGEKCKRQESYFWHFVELLFEYFPKSPKIPLFAKNGLEVIPSVIDMIMT